MIAGLPKSADHRRPVDDIRSALNLRNRAVNAQPRDVRRVVRSCADNTEHRKIAHSNEGFPEE